MKRSRKGLGSLFHGVFRFASGPAMHGLPLDQTFMDVKERLPTPYSPWNSMMANFLRPIRSRY